jgi:hypothetical protein
MARANIAAMLANKTQDEAEQSAELPAAAPASPEPARATKTAPKEPAPARPAKAPQVAQGGAGEARELFTKGAVLFLDQSADLDIAARRLNKSKSTPGTPRITANTLLRIAADLLLTRASELRGDTESELRESIGLITQHLPATGEN